jgi:hypothetical protein
MCDLYPFERLMATREKLPSDMYPFRNFLRGPQHQLSGLNIDFKVSWHPTLILKFSATPRLKIWNVIQYFKANEPESHFSAVDDSGNALDANIVLADLFNTSSVCCIRKAANRPNIQADALPYDPPNTRTEWAQTNINMHSYLQSKATIPVQPSGKSAPPTPPPPALDSQVQPLQAGRVSLVS